MVRMVGLEPTSASQGLGFKDRCVYQFHHTREISKTGNGVALPAVALLVAL